MFYGYPVEKLCTFQYSLVSLLPGLLQNLDDCGSPPLANRAQTLSKPNSLKTSDRKSMMAFMGLPLDLFGQDALFQPYLPLQQLDMLKDTPSWLCGCTNSIVTQQKEIDLLVHTETGVFEFRDPQLERSAGLTPADRKWMDDIIRDVNEGWDQDDPTKPHGMKFVGSDDYLRSKFEEYIHAALSTVKYKQFMAKGDGSGVIITGGAANDANAVDDFNPLWIAEFKKTRAYEVWERVTDPLLFDIVEPRHPCNEKPSVVADLGLRFQEGIQDLKLEQSLAPAREAVARTFATGSTNLLKAVEGVRGRWAAQRSPSSSSSVPAASSTGTSLNGSRASTPPVEVSKSDVEGEEAPKTATQTSFLRPFSFTTKSFSALTSPNPDKAAAGAPSAGANSSGSVSASPASSPGPASGGDRPPSGATSPLAGWGANFNSIGSFLSEKASRVSLGRGSVSQQGQASPPPQPQGGDRNSTGSVNGVVDATATKPAPSRAFSTWSSLSALVSPPPVSNDVAPKLDASPLPPPPAPVQSQSATSEAKEGKELKVEETTAKAEEVKVPTKAEPEVQPVKAETSDASKTASGPKEPSADEKASVEDFKFDAI
ncbi:hypothetical protein CC2G_012633 [Coprinopsis cinerea AmutBmut pab1-1]|nr:hypothetical protein CC2G_012633 [Coprinopsis cinerea AmutBmut pab1-1]